MKITNVKMKVLSNVKDSADTHTTKWFKEIWNDIIDGMGGHKWAQKATIVDPFARNCKLAYPNTNDLNPDTEARHNMCALDYLKSFKTDQVDLVIFDPPFSERKANVLYDGYGVNLYTSDAKLMLDCIKETSRILKAGGCLLKFGYDMNFPSPGFVLIGGWIMTKNFGNSTMVSLWVNEQHSLNSSKWN
jgi:23S rRNA G2445 N2-methylase RlmL